MNAPALAAVETLTWHDVCPLEDILPWTGVCALIGRRQIAVFRWGVGDTVYALHNFDPFSKAFVLSRGLVGSVGDVPKVASPLYKQCFDLRDGRCLDDPAVGVPSYPARVVGGRVQIGISAS